MKELKLKNKTIVRSFFELKHPRHLHTEANKRKLNVPNDFPFALHGRPNRRKAQIDGFFFIFEGFLYLRAPQKRCKNDTLRNIAGIYGQRKITAKKVPQSQRKRCRKKGAAKKVPQEGGQKTAAISHEVSFLRRAYKWPKLKKITKNA